MMTTPPKDPAVHEDESTPPDMLTAFIRKQVIRSLGSPANIFKVRVHPVGSDRYRVNVLVGKDATSARITDSFFLTADSTGKIISSSPEIARLY